MRFLALFSLVPVVCAVIIAWRLRKLAEERADAERRASVAFEEMSRFSQELRRRSADDPAADPALTPGERLQRLYPGRARASRDTSG